MKIVVTGGGGQVGRALARLAPAGHEVTALSSSTCDITDFGAVFRAISGERPDLIIHAAAMTDVDGCERDPGRAYQVNALGTQHVAAIAQTLGAALVYISTNFVFDGESPDPYHEFAVTRPLSVYGASKLAGEAAVRAIVPRHYVVRTAMVYDETGRNFVNTMLRLGRERPRLTVVADQTGNPTYAGDLAEAIFRLIARPAYGTYHLTNSGAASWCDWAVETFRLASRSVLVAPIPATAYERDARVPANGALANVAGAGLGITLPPWQDALERCLKRRRRLGVA